MATALDDTTAAVAAVALSETKVRSLLRMLLHFAVELPTLIHTARV